MKQLISSSISKALIKYVLKDKSRCYYSWLYVSLDFAFMEFQILAFKNIDIIAYFVLPKSMCDNDKYGKVEIPDKNRSDK